MRKTLLPSILLTAATLLSACGSPAPTADAPAAATQRAATATTSASSPTAMVATEPPAAGDLVQVDITLADNTIESSLTSFQTGVPYTFVITNTGRHAHNFNISQPVAEAGSLDAALQGALLAVPQGELAPGATVTREFSFPDSATGTNLELSCLIRRHYDDGMWLPITVTP